MVAVLNPLALTERLRVPDRTILSPSAMAGLLDLSQQELVELELGAEDRLLRLVVVGRGAVALVAEEEAGAQVPVHRQSGQSGQRHALLFELPFGRVELAAGDLELEVLQERRREERMLLLALRRQSH